MLVIGANVGALVVGLSGGPSIGTLLGAPIELSVGPSDSIPLGHSIRLGVGIDIRSTVVSTDSLNV